MYQFVIALIIVGLGLFFNFSNGFNDSANIVAVPVATKSFNISKLLIFAGIFEFVGAYFLGDKVSKTISTGIVFEEVFFKNKYGIAILFSALLSAIIWNLSCTTFGLPVSASHALIGGLVGSALGIGEFQKVHWNNVLKIFLLLLFVPLLSFFTAYILTKILRILLMGANIKIKKLFKHLEVFTSYLYALSHGTNDGQKAVGLITFSLIILGFSNQNIIFSPKWVIFLCALSLSLGIMFGSWKVIKTVGIKIYKIKDLNGVVSQFTSGMIIYIASICGLPLSTTHVFTTSVMGTGAAERVKGVRWWLSRDIFLAWLLTIPITATISFLVFKLIILFKL